MVKQKHLSDALTLISTPHFPYRSKKKKVYAHSALLGIGGNIGDVKRRFEHLFWYMKRSPFLHLTETAPLLKNPPFGFLEQEYFYNSILLVETNLTPRRLLAYLLNVERQFGRQRLFKDGPRTLDIDILFYDNVTMQTKSLTLPHPGWKERVSVLIPLSKMKGKVR